MESKETNPKDLVGINKAPLHLFPTTARMYGCLAFLEGALKYGRTNYRVSGVKASIYYDALNRHMDSWFEGEDIDEESGLPHLAKAIACIAILIEAVEAKNLNDDRVFPTHSFSQTLENANYLTKELLCIMKGRMEPRHYTIKDKDILSTKNKE